MQPSSPVAAPAILGKYRLIAELGQGGMADVYLAMIAGPTGSGFTKLAVVKRLRPNLVEDPEFVAMLVDEARISARLNHPNVVQTLEVGFEHEEYYLAMEFLDGQPLHRVQRRASRSGVELPRDLSCLVVADVLSGLHHAHELADYDGSPLGVVHRDVNPQNVFVTYDGAIKVVDFGIAKAAGRVAETRQGVVKGKVRYMSPEQALGSEIDRRSDLFAAGLLLWEAATGKRFWGELHDLDIIHALVTGDFDPSPRSVDPSVPSELDAMCIKALAFRAEDRYGTAGELRDHLEGFLSESLVAARRRLGRLVGDMFEKERADVRAVIARASRSAHDAPSMATLLGSTASQNVAAAPIESLAPVQMGPRSVPAAPPLPVASRTRANLLMAGMALVALGAVVLAIELKIPGGERGRGVGLASSTSATTSLTSASARESAASVEPSHVEVELRSATRKDVAGPPATSHPQMVRTSAPIARPPVAPPPAPPPAASAVPVQSARPEAPRRHKPAIDTADPWNKDEDAP